MTLTSLLKPHLATALRQRKCSSVSTTAANERNLLSRKVRYAFKFVSLLPIASASNTSLLSTKSANARNNLLVKQSYLLFTWMTYIQDSQSVTSNNSIVNKKPSFFIQRKTGSKKTYLKAPMAHKTFSQEQFAHQTYSISISLYNRMAPSLNIDSVNKSLYIALKLRNSFVPIETNLFFLKKNSVTYTSQDKQFMRLK